jgi:hypothetical protein
MNFNPNLFAKLEDGYGYNKIRKENILNPYVNFHNYTDTQSLKDVLVSESIQMRGVEVYYIRREYVNLDLIFGEDPSSRFEKAYKIAAYISSFEGYEGQRDFFSKFGMQVNDEITFQINPNLFKYQTDGKIPLEGDLVYFPMGNALFEVVWVEGKDPFYQSGTNSIMTVNCSKFIYSGEKLDAKVKVPISMQREIDAEDLGLDLSALTDFDEPVYLYTDELNPVNDLDGIIDIKKGEFAEDRVIRNESSEYVDPENFDPINADPHLIPIPDMSDPLIPPPSNSPFADF